MENCKTIDGKLIAFPHGADEVNPARDNEKKKNEAKANKPTPERKAEKKRMRKEKFARFMKIAAMVVRYVTVPPIMAAALILTVYFSNAAYIGGAKDLFAALGFLCVMPLLSYPVHAFVPALKKRGRKCQRNLAIVFSVFGYACGLVHAFAFHAAAQLSALYLTYAISGAIIAICSFVFKFKASGHASGVAGPVAALTLMISPYYAFGIIVLVACAISSVYVKRHTVVEFIAGAAFTVAALVFSMAVFGVL